MNSWHKFLSKNSAYLKKMQKNKTGQAKKTAFKKAMKKLSKDYKKSKK